MLGTAIGAGEERVLAIESKRTDCALDDVAVDIDATVLEKEAKAFPA
jgi:hypothetical protein